MAKKNGSTSKGLSVAAEEFIDQVRSGALSDADLLILRGRAEQMAESRVSVGATQQETLRAQPVRNLILIDFKPYDILDDLERLRAMVESGEINGLIFAAKYTNPGKQRHFFGASGRCAENIDEALGVATQLQMDIAKQAAK
jgi:hypothetical protein